LSYVPGLKKVGHRKDDVRVAGRGCEKQLVSHDELGLLQGLDPLIDVEVLVEEIGTHDVEQLDIAGKTAGLPLEEVVIDLCRVNFMRVPLT
jgi:hypothetical protein